MIYCGDAQSSPAGAAGLASVPTPLSIGEEATSHDLHGDSCISHEFHGDILIFTGSYVCFIAVFV